MKYYATANKDKKTPISYARFLHAAPNVNNLTVYINGIKTVPAIEYREFTEYYKSPSGLYGIKIYLNDDVMKKPLYDNQLRLEPGMIYTFAISGENNNLILDLISDTKKTINPNKASIRYINLSQEAHDLDITMNNIKQISDISYGDISKYIDLPLDTYLLNAYITGTKDKVLTVPNIKLREGRFYAAYIIGNLSKAPLLQVLLPLEGSSYLKF